MSVYPSCSCPMRGEYINHTRECVFTRQRRVALADYVILSRLRTGYIPAAPALDRVLAGEPIQPSNQMRRSVRTARRRAGKRFQS